MHCCCIFLATHISVQLKKIFLYEKILSISLYAKQNTFCQIKCEINFSNHEWIIARNVDQDLNFYKKLILDIQHNYLYFSFIESFCINNRIRKINSQQKINTKIFFQSSSWLCNKQSKGLKNDLVHWVLFYLQLHHLKFISWGFWCGGSGGVWNWVKWSELRTFGNVDLPCWWSESTHHHL